MADPAMQLDILLDIKKVCRIVGVHPSTIFRMEQRGEFPHRIHVAGRTMWSQREIADWLGRVKAVRADLPPIPPNRMSRKMIHARAHAPRTKRLRFAS